MLMLPHPIMHYCILLFYNFRHPAFVPAAKTLVTPHLSIVNSDGWFLLPPGVDLQPRVVI